MALNQDAMERVQAKVTKSLQAHSTLFLVEGVVLLILGVLSIIVPQVATIAVSILIGWLILVSGIVGLISTFMMRSAPGFGWSLLSAVLATVAGAILLWSPLRGALTLTLILTVFLAFEGVFSILYAFEHRRELSGRWGMMLFSGILDLVLAAFIFLGLPATAAWAIGTLVGINLIFGGVAMITMALHARSQGKPGTPSQA
jgi:uncharacterized membrane protein HdeD (DUF308 family)